MRSEVGTENPDVEALDCLYLSEKWPSLWSQITYWDKQLRHWEGRQDGASGGSATRQIYASYIQQALIICAAKRKRENQKLYMRGAATIH